MNKHLKSLIFAFNALDIVYHYGPIKLEMPSSDSDQWKYFVFILFFCHLFYAHTLPAQTSGLWNKNIQIIGHKVWQQNKTRMDSTKELVCWLERKTNGLLDSEFFHDTRLYTVPNKMLKRSRKKRACHGWIRCNGTSICPAFVDINLALQQWAARL